MGRKKKTEIEKLSLDDLEKKIEQIAEEKGLFENYFFRTTFERYRYQLRLLRELRQGIESEGMYVAKTYVKDRPNIQVNPAISEYNKTCSAANGTAATLIKILGGVQKSDSTEGQTDLVADFLQSR